MNGLVNPVTPADVAVVIPTLGHALLADILRTLDAADQHPAEVVVVDDRPEPCLTPLALPEVGLPVRVLRSGGRGPAAARNVGWVATEAGWVAFVDDDVELADDWFSSLLRDLSACDPSVGASTATIVVPEPAGRRPTDEERRTTGLSRARWITADMAYRREVLLHTGGFDERFPRAFREDADLALRTLDAGWSLAAGDRVTVHPLRSRGGWRSSLTAQRGNADNALLRSKFGPDWRSRIGGEPGRTGRHLLAVSGALIMIGGTFLRRSRSAQVGAALWAGTTAEFALRRILPGPRTMREITAMIISSVVIPPLALGWRLLGEIAVRLNRWPRPRAVLFDRDGTLILDVPYLRDPARVDPVDGAQAELSRLRADGLALGVVSNQSGLARRLIDPAELAAVNARVESGLGPFGTWQICPHGPDSGCRCRKPAAGLVRTAAQSLGVRPRDCVVIGDIGSDVQAALRAGARAVLVPTAVTRTSEIAHAQRNAAVAENLTAAVRLAVGGPR